jgi:GAF domain-containing protein
VRSFEKSKKQADFESLVNTIGQRIQRTTSIEETLQTAIREIGTALSAQRVRANLVIDRQAGEPPSSQN